MSARRPDPLANLGPRITQRRAELGLTMRQAAELSGVPIATLSRIEQGRSPDLETFRKLIAWLGVEHEAFFSSGQSTSSTPDTIAAHLRQDPSLTAEAADRISEIVRDLYWSLSVKERRLAVHLKAAKTFVPGAMSLLAGILDDIEAALNARENGE